MGKKTHGHELDHDNMKHIVDTNSAKNETDQILKEHSN